MTVRVYRSTDASAPVLTGAAGSLVALLDACLVNGYGALAAAGWTKALTAANKAGYKQNLTGANNASGMYLYVDDTAPGAGGAREARVCGFETMSAITPTGTGQFPTAAQSAIGTGQLVIRKSLTADATARAWTLVANGQTIYLFIETGDQPTPNVGALTFVFGDFKSYKSGDQYAVGIIARNIENSGAATNEPFSMMGGQASNTWGPSAKYFGHFVARHWTGLGGSIQFGKSFDYGKFGQNIFMGWQTDTQTAFGGTVQMTSGRNTVGTNAQFPAPNGPDGAIWLSPVYNFHNWSFRGYWPGMWAVLHDKPLAHNDVITIASGNLNGKTLLCQQFYAYISGNETGQIMIETSDTWS